MATIAENNGKASSIRAEIKEFKYNLLNNSDYKNWTKEQIETKIKEIFKNHNVSDKDLKLICIAVNLEESSTTSSGVETYSSIMADRLYKKKEKKYTDKKERLDSHYYIKYDINKLKSLNTEKEIRDYAYECLKDAGMTDEIIHKHISNVKYFETPFKPVDLPDGSTLDVFTKILKILKAQQEKQSQQETQSGKSQSKTPTLDRGLQNLLDENEEIPPKKEIGESARDFNFFVGYDKNKVSRLFQGKEETFEKFEEFVKVYNYLMTLYTTQNLSPDRAKEISNDLLPNYNEVVKECSSLGGEGSRIKGLCEGMMSILDQTYKAENSKDGENLNPSTAEQNIRHMGLTPDEVDGLRNEGITISNKAPEDQTFAGEISDLIGTKNLANPTEPSWESFTDEELDFITYMGIDVDSPSELHRYLDSPIGQQDIENYEKMSGEKVLRKN